MRISTLNVRGLNTRIQEWGEPGNPTLMLLHGWMDCGATFKFVAEHLQNDFHLVAPDWRGFGETDHAAAYWFPDYFADLEVMLDKYSPTEPAKLAGHSMGGNIAMMYAGVQPHRVSHVLSLEALGMAPSEPQDAPNKYRRWMREILSDEPSKIYPNLNVLMHSIHKGNPSLPISMIEQLADLWAKPFGDGGAMQLKHDHKHRYANPVRYNFDDVLEVWQQVTARVGLVMADQSNFYSSFSQSGRIDQAQQLFNMSEDDYFLVANSAHMLHLEQPEQTADCIRAFFNR